jgi:hypothetical protein
MIALQSGGGEHAEGDEDQRPRPLRGFLETRRMRIVIQLEMVEPASDARSEINLLVTIATHRLADCKGLAAGGRGSFPASEPNRYFTFCASELLTGGPSRG